MTFLLIVPLATIKTKPNKQNQQIMGWMHGVLVTPICFVPKLYFD